MSESIKKYSVFRNKQQPRKKTRCEIIMEIITQNKLNSWIKLENK